MQNNALNDDDDDDDDDHDHDDHDHDHDHDHDRDDDHDHDHDDDDTKDERGCPEPSGIPGPNRATPKTIRTLHHIFSLQDLSKIGIIV